MWSMLGARYDETAREWTEKYALKELLDDSLPGSAKKVLAAARSVFTGAGGHHRYQHRFEAFF